MKQSNDYVWFYLRVVVGAAQEHFADRALSLPTEPKRVISQAPVHSARLPVKLSPDQISSLHDSENRVIQGHYRSGKIFYLLCRTLNPES